MRYPNRPVDFGSKERRVGYASGGAVMPGKRTGYAGGGGVEAIPTPTEARKREWDSLPPTLRDIGNFYDHIHDDDPPPPGAYNYAEGGMVGGGGGGGLGFNFFGDNTQRLDPTVEAWRNQMMQAGPAPLPAVNPQPMPSVALPPRADAANPSTLASVPYREVNLDSLRSRGRQDLEQLAGPMRERMQQPIRPTPGYAGGGMVQELQPRQPMNPQAMIPQPGGPAAGPNRFGIGPRQIRRPFAEGGHVKSQDEVYVTGDQLAGQVQERFTQALAADDKYRRNYDDGGTVDAADPAEVAVAEAERERQAEAERQREATEAAEADRRRQAEESEAAEMRMQRADDETIHRAGGQRVGADDVGVEIPSEEQTPLSGTPAEERLALDMRKQQADVDEVRAAGLDQVGAEIPAHEQVPIGGPMDYEGDRPRSDEGTLIPPSEQVPYAGVDPAQEQTGYRDAADQAAATTDDWLKEVLDYSHAKIDPAEINPPPAAAAAPAARTGYATDPEEAERAGAADERAAAMAAAAAPPAPPAAAAPATEPPGPRAGATTSTAGLPELAGRAALKVGEKALGYFKSDPFEPQRPWGAVDDNSLQMKLAQFIRGEGAFPPDQMLQMIRADENGDWNKSVQQTFDSFKGDRESGFKFMQGLRPIYENHIGFAQAAADAGRPDAVAKALERAHNFLPNNTYMKVDPAEGGYTVTLRSEKDPNAPPALYSLSNQQMNDFLKSNGSQFDSMASNSTAKNLDILMRHPGVSATRGDIPPDQAGDIPRTPYMGTSPPAPPATPEDLTPSMPPDKPYTAGPSGAATVAGADPERPYDALSTEQRVGAPTRTATGEQGEGFDPRMLGYRAGAADRTIEPAVPNLYEKQAREDQAAARAEQASRPAPGRRVGSVKDVMESNTMASPRSYNPGSLKGIYPKNNPLRWMDDGYYIPNAEQIDAGFVTMPRMGQNYGSKYEQQANAAQMKKWNAAGKREATAMDTGNPNGVYRDAAGTLRYGSYTRAGEGGAPAPGPQRIGSPYASAGSGAEQEIVEAPRGGGRGARERPGDMVVHPSGYDPSGAPAFSSRQVGGPMLREQLGHPAFMDPTYRYPNDQQPIYPSRTSRGTITAQQAADARRDSPDYGTSGRAGRGPFGPDMRRADEESLRSQGYRPEEYVVKGPQGAGSIQQAQSTTPIGPGWTPAYGRGQVAPPPPPGDTSPAARAARQYPGITETTQRRTAEQVFQKQADEEGLEREKIAGRTEAAKVTGEARTTAATTRAAGYVTAAGIKADGSVDRESIRAASHERIAAEKQRGLDYKHEDKMEIARDNLEFMKSKAVADIAARTGNQATRSTMAAITKKIETGAPLNPTETAVYDDLLATARDTGKRSPSAYIPLGTPGASTAPAAPAAGTTAPAAAGPRTAAPVDSVAAGSAVDAASRDMASGRPGATPSVRVSGRPPADEKDLPDLKTYRGTRPPWKAGEGQKWQYTKPDGPWKLVKANPMELSTE